VKKGLVRAESAEHADERAQFKAGYVRPLSARPADLWENAWRAVQSRERNPRFTSSPGERDSIDNRASYWRRSHAGVAWLRAVRRHPAYAVLASHGPGQLPYQPIPAWNPSP